MRPQSEWSPIDANQMGVQKAPVFRDMSLSKFRDVI